MNLWKNNFKPMLLDEIEKPFNSKDYLFELKFDGNRALIKVSPEEFKIYNRHNMEITYLYPELKSIQALVKEKVIFDGEIIICKDGKPNFSELQKRAHLKDINKIKRLSKKNPVTFICFDILYKNKNLCNLDLIKRKEILNITKDNDYFIKIKSVLDNGITLFKEIKKRNLEGIVAKKKDSKYEINTRTKDWIKIKNFIEETFYIGGYTYKEDSHVFSVLLGEYKNNKLYFVGKVFIAKKNKLFKLIKQEKSINSKFVNHDKENIIYIKPKYKCSVKYIERTTSNNLRQPFYVRSNNE